MQPDRIFLDTNVLLSGLIFKGNESKVLEFALAGRIRLVIADAVVDEAREVLTAKFPAHVGVLDRFLNLLDYEPVPVPSTPLIEEAGRLVRDPGDAVILATIIASRPSHALTGDKDLLVDEIRALVPVCTCAEYLNRNRE